MGETLWSWTRKLKGGTTKGWKEWHSEEKRGEFKAGQGCASRSSNDPKAWLPRRVVRGSLAEFTSFKCPKETL